MKRFWDKVDQSSLFGCWEWTAAKDENGYGWFRLERTMVRAHRMAYELRVGSIPAGIKVCHTCDNPSCVNPAHLWLGTQTENVLDMKEKGRAKNANTDKTHCKYGHPFSKENTYVDNWGQRKCRVCRNRRQREYTARKRMNA